MRPHHLETPTRWLLLLALLSGGCATLVSGTHQRVRVESDAPGAIVRVEGGETAELPAQVQISRRSAVLIVSAPDHEEATVRPSRGFNAITLLNLLGIGLLGIAVDAGTGAMFRYVDPIFVRLERAAEPAYAPPADFAYDPTYDGPQRAADEPAVLDAPAEESTVLEASEDEPAVLEVQEEAPEEDEDDLPPPPLIPAPEDP